MDVQPEVETLMEMDSVILMTYVTPLHEQQQIMVVQERMRAHMVMRTMDVDDVGEAINIQPHHIPLPEEQSDMETIMEAQQSTDIHVEHDSLLMGMDDVRLILILSEIIKVIQEPIMDEDEQPRHDTSVEHDSHPMNMDDAQKTLTHTGTIDK